MTTSGGFCLLPFIENRKSVFAANNVDFLENTADGQNTLHGTILVINQNKDSDSNCTTCFPVNEPLHIPDNVRPIAADIKLHHPPSLAAKPITVISFEIDSYQHVIRKYEMYNRAWFMASFSKRANTTVDAHSSAIYPATEKSPQTDFSQLTEPLANHSPLPQQFADEETHWDQHHCCQE